MGMLENLLQTRGIGLSAHRMKAHTPLVLTLKFLHLTLTCMFWDYGKEME